MGVLTITPQLIPIVETILIIIQTILLMAGGGIIIKQWKQVKTTNDVNKALGNAIKETEENVERVKIISEEINNLNNKLNNFDLPNDAKDDIIVDLIKKTANILADRILSKEEDLKILHTHKS